MTATNPAPLEPLWDAADVAHFLKCSRKTAYRKAESGEIPSVRIGGLLRFDPATIRGLGRGEPPTPVARVFPLLPRP